VERALDERLRALFPEVQGDFSRAAITRAVLDATPEKTGDPAVAADVPSAAVVAIRRGEYDQARSLLGVLVTQSEVARARGFLASGDLRAAVRVLDHAVATAPESADLRILRADTSSEIVLEALRGPRAESRAPQAESRAPQAESRGPLVGEARDHAERALTDYVEAAKKRGGPRAELGASRAALWLERYDEARLHARAGIDALDGQNIVLPGGATPESVWADAMRLGRATQSVPENAKDLDEARTASFAALARDPRDPKVWGRLVGVESDRGADTAARSIAQNGLALFPDSSALHEWLAGSVTQSAGREATIREYERFTAAHPTSAPALWTLASERLASAFDEFAAGRANPAAFQAAEADFKACKKTDGTRSAECDARIATTRAGLGFARARQGDLDGARDAFLSVEDAAKGALSTAHAPLAESALAGLAEIGARYIESESGSGGAGLEALEKAARVFDYVHEYDRANVHYARLAASSNRDAAVALEIGARALAAAGKVDEANRRLTRAKEMMERALAGFQAALELQSEDATTLREAGRVLVDYLQRDPTVARGWLAHAAAIDERRVVDMRTRAIDDKGSARALEEIESNLSDAYRSLGVLELTLVGDAASALAWFEICLATGPDAGADVRGPKGWLARCKEALASKRDTRIQDADRWAASLR